MRHSDKARYAAILIRKSGCSSDEVATAFKLLIFFLHSALDLSVCRFLCHILALVIELFASAKTDSDLDVRALEIEGKGNEGISLSRYETRKLHDLALMHEELSRAKGVSVENISLLVGADMYTEGKELTLVDLAIGILEIYRTAPQRFYLGSIERDPRLVYLVYKIIVPCLSVFGNGFRAFFSIAHNNSVFDVYLIILAQTFYKINTYLQISDMSSTILNFTLYFFVIKSVSSRV